MRDENRANGRAAARLVNGSRAAAASRVVREFAVDGDCGELRSAPHAILQGAPAREAMPQKTTARQARGSEPVLKTFGIALNSRRKFFWRRKRKSGRRNRPHRFTPKFAAKIRKQ
jgi:hypothetical protein